MVAAVWKCLWCTLPNSNGNPARASSNSLALFQKYLSVMCWYLTHHYTVLFLADLQMSILRVDVSIKSMKSNLFCHHRYTDSMPRPKGLETNCVGLNCNLTGLQIVHEGTAWCEPAFMNPQSYPVLCRCSSLKIREQKQAHRASQGHKSREATIYKDNLQDWGQRKQGEHTHNLTALPVS